MLSALATAAGAFTLLFSAATAVLGARLLRRLGRRPAPHGLPPVTVIKPLKGAEASLYGNLASFCRQDYPRFQLLLCLQSETDPAAPVARRIAADFPDADVEVVVSPRRIGFNPKVNNMANAYGRARHALLLLSDSDVLARPDLLRRMAAPFADPSVGLVTAFYQAVGARGLWGRLEALSVNAHFLPQALAAAAFGMRFAMGAAMMVRREAFDAAGGFRNLADHIADDFRLGESVRAAGWRLELCASAVDVVPDIDSGPGHFLHLARWARTVRICQPWGYAASVVQHGFSLLTLKALLAGPDPLTLALLAGIWASKAGAAAVLGSALDGRRDRRDLWLLPLSEWLAFGAWAAGCAWSRVLWRGELYDVRSRGRLVPVRAPAPAGVEA